MIQRGKCGTVIDGGDGLLEQRLEALLHLERQQVLARDEPDDVVMNIDDDQMTQAQSSKNDVRAIQRVVLVDLRHRDVDE